MRLIVRIVGTWLLGMALILLVIDGTRSLGAGSLTFTSFADAWAWIHAGSLVEARAFLETRLFGPVLGIVANAVFSCPGWAVLGVPGAILGWTGRSRRSRMFVRQDQV